MPAAESHLGDAAREWAEVRDHHYAWEDRSGPQRSPFSEYDQLGRKQPRRLAITDYLLMIARIEPERVRRVPVLAVPESGEDDDGPFALVTCPCGGRPIARSALEQCSGCERYYAEVGGGVVFVVYGAMKPPPLLEKNSAPSEVPD